MASLPHHVTSVVGVALGHPLAFVAVGAFVAGWLAVDPESMDGHGVATILTLLMTIFITRAQQRDTAALQAKLDELLRATQGADEGLARLDERELEEIEEQRDARNAPS